MNDALTNFSSRTMFPNERLTNMSRTNGKISLLERLGYDSSANSLAIVAITNKIHYIPFSRRSDIIMFV